jgi:hypothetical protein
MLGRWIGVLILPVAGITALSFFGLNAYDCLSLQVGMLLWGILCCLVGTFLCAVLFAVFRAPPVTYVVLVAAVTLVTAAGWGLAYATSDACGEPGWRSGTVLFSALWFLVASLIGLLLGFLVGYLLAALIRWLRQA